MKTRFICLSICLLLLCAFAASPQFSLAAEEPLAAQAISITPEAWVERGGQKTPLQQKDKIYRSDVVLTGPAGRVQLLFEDDTVIAMGPDSSVAISDFSFGEGKKPNFAANMAKGTARFVTGQIVKQNKEGFNVSTPTATIGIRGTTVYIQLSPEMAKFVVEAMEAGNTVVIRDSSGNLHTLGSSGQGLILGPDGATYINITPGELHSNNNSTTGSGTGNTGDGDGDDPIILTGTTALATDNLNAALVTETGNFLGDSRVLPQIQQTQQTVFYSGSVVSANVGYRTGTFSFTGDLFHNNITDATFNIADSMTPADFLNAANGSGAIFSDRSYKIENFTIVSKGGDYAAAIGLTMNGNLTPEGTTSGTWEAQTTGAPQDDGTYQTTAAPAPVF